ncbi:MAG: GAF domain-containing protein [Bacteroidetes bacterium]|jgi:signal transduction histidine kinase|nr:GAF domain-containing protein [Bacteroidota bacterium]
MKQQEEQREPKSFIKFFSNLNPRYFNFDQKLRTILIFITLVSTFVIASIGFYVSKVDARNFTINHLSAIQEAKKQYLEDYFQQVRRQISMLSQDELIINSTIEFKRTFQNIENDSYFTPEINSLQSLDQKLRSFYQTEYAEKVNQKLDRDFDLDALYPEDTKTKILQYLYIAKSEQSHENKHLMNKAADQSMYSYAHSDYHPQLRNMAADFGFEDIYLIDNISGHVVYSLKKDFDFAADLMMGRYKNTNLARVYKEAIVGSKNFVKFSDYQIHIPSLGQPSIYVSAPIYQGGSKLGVLVCKIPNRRIHNILTSGNNYNREGLGETGQLFLVGEDMTLRSNTRELIEKKEDYLKKLQKSDYSSHAIDMINNLNTNILLQKVDLRVVKEALKGESSEQIESDFGNEKIIATASPVAIDDLNWAIVAQMNLEETYSSFRKLRNIVAISAIIFILLSVFLGHKIAQGFSTRIIVIRNALTALSRGESFKKIKDKNNDEITETVNALRSLSDRIDYAAEFAQAIGGGNFNAYFEPQSEQDKFGHALTRMKESLVKAQEEEKKRQVEDEIRNWITNGIAKFSELLRKDNDDIDRLTYNIIKEMVAYIEANIAGMYLLNDDDPNNPYYELKATYAYDRKKYLDIQFKPGEGLVGTCALERQAIFLKEIPDDYIDITSGFGHANPRSLFLVPLKADDIVYGVIEIGSLQVFKDYQIEFIERLAESIAATLVTVRLNVKTQKLLKESEERSNEIKQQEEEMRQNLEEMVATQEELERVRKDEERKIAELNDKVEASEKRIIRIMNRISGSMLVKNQEGIILYANEQAAKDAYLTIDEIIGKTGMEDLSIEEADKIMADEQRIIESDKDEITYQVKKQGKSNHYTQLIKGPIILEANGEKGLFVWEMNYTEYRKFGEEEIKEELGEFKEKLKDTMKELKQYRDKYGDK